MTSVTSDSPASPASAVTHIRPRRGWQPIDLGEVWQYHELLWFLAMRDIKVRYKQTVLGVAWAIIPPLMTMLVFNVLFGLLMGRDQKPTVPGVPYAVSTFCALLPWQFFATSVGQAGNGLVANQSLITKVYFPRLIVPLSSVIAGLVDFCIAFIVLAGLMVWYGIVPTWTVLTLPLFLALAVMTAAAVGLWLAALNALYRDFRFVIPFAMQFGMYLSPVVYSAPTLMEKLSPATRAWVEPLYYLNPMAGVIEGFRWALLPNYQPPGLIVVASAAVMAVVLMGGLLYFRRMERFFADLV